ncbi:serine/arginine-rich splicing factor 8-like [Watersipora subatra]|uniref:serine/arginine-rich splicing factor 8-like n=1 Tax=Watersipora subatra TaxID=2589382 RepID=UPI00355B0E87
MATSHDSAGFKLFTELYRKKRVKDGCRELPRREFEGRVSARWKALSADQYKRYNDEAIQRLTRTPVRKRYISYSTRPVAVKRRVRSISPSSRKPKRSHQSRSQRKSSGKSSRSRSFSASSAQTDYLGESTYISASSYTDTASTYYDDDEYSDATSCSSIASSYEDLTETIHKKPSKPSTSNKVAQTHKLSGGSKELQTKKSQPTKTTKRRNVQKKLAVPRVPKKVGISRVSKTKPHAPKRESKSKKKAGKITRPRRPRAVTTKRVIPLRRTRASRNVNVKETDAACASPPRQMLSEDVLKATSVDSKCTARSESIV